MAVEKREIAGRPGVIQAIALREDHQLAVLDRELERLNDAELVQCFVRMRLGPHTTATWSLIADLALQEQVLEMARGLADSVAMTPPSEFAEQRRHALEAGRDFLSHTDRSVPPAGIPREQLFRVLSPSGIDFGVARLFVVDDPVSLDAEGFAHVGERGYGVGVHTTEVVGEVRITRLEKAFVSGSGDHETWSRQLTMRPAVGGVLAGDSARAVTVADSGVRSRDRITATRELPPSRDAIREVERFEKLAGATDYDTAPEGRVAVREFELHGVLPPTSDGRPAIPPAQTYLSQAEALVRFADDDPDLAETLAFYAFDGETQRLALRHVHRTPLAGGGVEVAIYATADSPAEYLVFGPGGRLTMRIRPDGSRWPFETPPR